MQSKEIGINEPRKRETNLKNSGEALSEIVNKSFQVTDKPINC